MASKILLIASEPKLVRQLSTFLSDVGYTIRVCPESKTAVDYALAFQPDLVISDDQLAVIGGAEMARLFKSQPNLVRFPFLLLAREESVSSAKRASRSLRADSILTKPFNQSEFYAVVSALLEGEVVPDRKDKDDPAESDFGLIRGTISPITLTRGLYSLLSSHVGGHLRCKSDRKKLRLSILNKRIVDAQSNYMRDDSLGRFLLQIGKITEKEHQTTLDKAAHAGETQGEILVRAGILTTAEMHETMRKLKVKETLALFEKSWQGGYFEFRPESVIVPPDHPANLKISDFLKQGLKRHVSIRWTIRAFEHKSRDRERMRLTPRFDDVCRLLELDREAVDMAHELQGRTIAELRTDPLFDANDLIHLVFLLSVTQGLALGDAPSGGRPKTAIEKEMRAPMPFDVDTARDDEFIRVFQSAQQAFYDNDYVRADALLRDTLAINERSADALAMQAWVRFSLADRSNLFAAQEAKDLLKRALTINDRNDQAHYFLGMILKYENKFSLAATHFRMAFDINPMNEEAEKEAKLALIRLRTDRSHGLS